MEIFGRKPWLDQTNNPSNGRGVLIKERVPRIEKDLKEHAESLGFITTTFNCNVKVFKKNTEGVFRSVVEKKYYSR